MSHFSGNELDKGTIREKTFGLWLAAEVEVEKDLRTRQR